MKKFISLMVFIFLFTSIVVYSQCPTGYSEDTTALTLSDGCVYDVVVCYNCSPTSNYNIYVFAFHKVDSTCLPSLSPADALAEINSQLLDETYIRSICNADTIGPCNSYPYGYWWDVRIPGCWYKINDATYGLWYLACTPERACDQIWRICWDYTIPGYKYELVQEYYFSMPGACTSADTEPPDPSVGNETDCFYIKTPCADDI